MVSFFKGATCAAALMILISACGMDGDRWVVACIAEVVSGVMFGVFYKAAELAADKENVW